MAKASYHHYKYRVTNQFSDWHNGQWSTKFWFGWRPNNKNDLFILWACLHWFASVQYGTVCRRLHGRTARLQTSNFSSLFSEGQSEPKWVASGDFCRGQNPKFKFFFVSGDRRQQSEGIWLEYFKSTKKPSKSRGVLKVTLLVVMRVYIQL